MTNLLTADLHLTSNPSDEYRQLEEFPGYRFGRDGSVWSCRIKKSGAIDPSRWKKLKPQKQKGNGSCCLRIRLRKNSKCKAKIVSHLILEAFVGPKPSQQHQALHFPDPAFTNNRVENLRWGTSKENCRDRLITGGDQRGEKSPSAKLKWVDIPKIHKMRQRGKSLKAIGNRFCVSDNAIRRVLNGSSYQKPVIDKGHHG